VSLARLVNEPIANRDDDSGWWERVRQELAGLPDGRGLNIAHEAVDRHAEGRLADHPALRYVRREGPPITWSSAELRDESNRFANVLRSLGVAREERVFTLASNEPEVSIAALGTLRNGSVFCALFSAFGPEPIFQRLAKGDAKVVVTTSRLDRHKLESLRPHLPQLERVLLTDAQQDAGPGLWSLPQRMASASTESTIPPTDPEDMAFLFFASGTTGTPKGRSTRISRLWSPT